MNPNGVVYQIYPRSFQDSDGDGVGDLAGIRSRLDYLEWLGVDALWTSPIYPSPNADFGYDVSDYTGVDPVYGDLEQYDRLLEEAHARGLSVLMDVVPCHTSIEHQWFREHPDWYIWRDEPNNWLSAFGGSAWRRLGDRYYLHSFYPEQPDLDWRNPEVIAAMQDVFRFWLERGADGYRIDAIDRLLKDRELRDEPPATQPFGLPLTEEEAKLLTSTPATPPTPVRRSPRSARPAARPSSSARSTCRAGSGSPTPSTSTRSSRSSSCTRPGRPPRCARRSRRPPASRAPPGSCRTTTSAVWPRASASATRGPPRCCC